LATSAAAEKYQNPRTGQTLGSSQSTFNESSHQNETPDHIKTTASTKRRSSIQPLTMKATTNLQEFLLRASFKSSSDFPRPHGGKNTVRLRRDHQRKTNNNNNNNTNASPATMALYTYYPNTLSRALIIRKNNIEHHNLSHAPFYGYYARDSL